MNHLELCGVETTLKKLVKDLNMAEREGTLKDVENALAAIEVEAREAKYIAERLQA
jgi:hypothetical protein